MAKSVEKAGGVGGFVASVPEFVQQVRTETGKVAWPNRRETLMTAVMVIVMTTILGVFFFSVDKLFDTAAQALLKLVA